MKKPALRRASRSTALLLIAAVLFVAGMAGSTFAYFDAQDDNAVVLSGGYAFPPATVTTLGSLTGPIQTIRWAQPTTTGANYYELRMTDMGTTTSSCPSRSTTVTQTELTSTTRTVLTSTVSLPQTYPQTVGTLAAPATTAAATISNADNGYYACFQVASAQTLGGWYSPPVDAQSAPIRVGLWPNTVALTNVATNNKIAATDQIKITYNQNVNASASGFTVCTFSAGTIIIGDQSNCASTSDSYTIGKITGLTIGANLTFTNSSISAASSVATVTLNGASGLTTTASQSGTGTYTSGTGSVVTTPGSPSLQPCTVANCTKTTSGGF